MPDFISSILRTSTTEIKEPDLFFSMQEFLNNPTYNTALELRNKINDGIPKDTLKDLCNIAHKILK